MPVPPPQSERVLLVEGLDDQHVVRRICERLLPTCSFHISVKGNWEQLRDSIGAEVKVPGRQVLGILADANDNPEARWATVASRLKSEGIQAPEWRDPDGTIISGDLRTGVWLMPNNQSPGELEDFVAGMIPPKDPVWPRAQSYISAIPISDRKFSANKILRAQIHAWLAARNEPRQMGLAIHTHDLAVDGPLCTRFVQWLANLFQ